MSRFWPPFFCICSVLTSIVAHADPCTEVGPCSDCKVSYDNLEQLNEGPLLYWDTCNNEQSNQPVIHYFPRSLIPIFKDNRKLVNLRTRSNGELVLSAKLAFYPWSNESEINKVDSLERLRESRPSLSFAPAIAQAIEFDLFGEWKKWIKTQRISKFSGLDIHRTVSLSLSFKSEYSAVVRHTLEREGGLIGRAKVRYYTYDKSGKPVDKIHSIPLVIGSVTI